MPQFIQTTDKLLNDPEYLKHHQMDIQVKSNDQAEDEKSESEDDKQADDKHKTINMVY